MFQASMMWNCLYKEAGEGLYIVSVLPLVFCTEAAESSLAPFH